MTIDELPHNNLIGKGFFINWSSVKLQDDKKFRHGGMHEPSRVKDGPDQLSGETYHVTLQDHGSDVFISENRRRRAREHTQNPPSLVQTFQEVVKGLIVVCAVHRRRTTFLPRWRRTTFLHLPTFRAPSLIWQTPIPAEMATFSASNLSNLGATPRRASWSCQSTAINSSNVVICHSRCAISSAWLWTSEEGGLLCMEVTAPAW